MKTIKFKKGEIEFTVIIYLSTVNYVKVKVESDFLYSTADVSKTELHCFINTKEKRLSFSGYLKKDGKKFSGIDISAVPELLDAYSEMQAESVKLIKLENQRRDEARTAETIDYDKYVIYSYGCDTGILHHESKEVILRALKNGAKEIPLYRGKRDKTSSFPGCMDAHIPEWAIKKDEAGKPYLEGYDYIYIDAYCVSKADFDAALLEIENSEETKKRREEERKEAEKRAREEREESEFDMTLNKVIYEEDEDGRQPCYQYKVRHRATGKEFHFSDRNIFDFGRVINPDFEIAPEWGCGGILAEKQVYITPKAEEIKQSDIIKSGYGSKYIIRDGREYCLHPDGTVCVPSGETWWQNCEKADGTYTGWQYVRKATDLETIAHRLVEKRGRGMREIRM